MLELCHQIDQTGLTAFFAGGGPAWLVAAAAFVTALGSGWMLLPIAAAGLGLRKTRRQVAGLLAACFATAAVVFALKFAIGRVRPCNASPDFRIASYSTPTDPSLPSGHAAGVFATIGFLLVARRRLGLALTPLAVLIAASRIVLGVHYPTDVAAGALIGLTTGVATARLWQLRAEPKPEVAGAAAPGAPAGDG